MALSFQAFIDDSTTPGGEFVLAGHIAPAEAWAKFAKEWEELLPFGTLAENGKYHFKMSEWHLIRNEWSGYRPSIGSSKNTFMHPFLAE